MQQSTPPTSEGASPDDEQLAAQSARAYFDQLDVDRPTPIAADDEPAGTDGRTMRRTRNREAVIRSLLELMRAGAIEPSVAEIAQLAGVSHRSVFRYFDDLTDLVHAAFEQAIADATPLGAITDPGEGPLEHRIEMFVDARLRLFDHVNEVARIARLKSATIPAIDESIRAIAVILRTQICDQFSEELSVLEPVDADHVADAILVLVSFEAYDLQLRIFSHSPDRIGQMWTRTVATLLRP